MDISPLHFPLDLWFPAMLLLWLRHLSKTELRIFLTSKRRGQSNRTTDDNAHQRKQPQAEKLNTFNISIWILDWLTTVWGVSYRSVIWFLEQGLRNLFDVCRLATDPQECVGSQRIRLTVPGCAAENNIRRALVASIYKNLKVNGTSLSVSIWRP